MVIQTIGFGKIKLLTVIIKFLHLLVKKYLIPFAHYDHFTQLSHIVYFKNMS